MNERNQTIYERRQQGETYAAIAKDFGVSVGRVREIVANAQKRVDYRKAFPEIKGDEITLQSPVASVLDRRPANTLRRARLATLQDVADLIVKNGLVPEPHDSYTLHKAGGRINQFGKKAWGQICSALDSAGFDWKSYVKHD